MFKLYYFIMQIFAPFLRYYLKSRIKRGKEDPLRLLERFGKTNTLRPLGKLIWLHGASVGEAVSILKLIKELLALQPKLNILITSGTITSAKLLSQNLPKNCLHQFIPIDVPRWVQQFLNHWQPNLAIFIESELWPNMLHEIKKRKVPLLLLNARMSENSFNRWQRIPKTCQKLFGLFNACFTSDSKTAKYLHQLGAKNIRQSSNIKFASDNLTFHQEELDNVHQLCAKRLIWAATSTHSGEEEIIIATHILLKKQFPNLLTILAPRHPSRTEEITRQINDAGLKLMIRSKDMYPDSKTDIWLIDTIGDLGLVYSLVKVCFVGGSFVKIGGHNPIEAFKLGAAVIVGPYVMNFFDVNETLQSALISVPNVTVFQEKLQYLLNSPQEFIKLVELAQNIIHKQQQGLSTMANDILDYLP